jgi:hypothetical protein
MKDERHFVVEEPDGSVAIAFNPEVPPPPDPVPPPEIQHVQEITRIRYSIAVKFACIFLLLTCILQFILYGRGLDAMNMLFMGTTTIAMYGEKPFSVAWLTIHGFTTGLLCIITAAMLLWHFAVYQFACMGVCIIAIVTCEAVFE